MAHEWERYANANIGVPLRLFFYFHVLPDRKLASALLTEDCPWWAGPLYKLIFPAVRKRMRAVYHIDAEGAKAAEAKLLAAFDHVEQRLEKRKFLAGPLFSRADLSVSALLTPRRRFTQPLPAVLLIDGSKPVQGSDAIITYLDKKQSHPPLTPTTTADASMAHEWERYANANIGVPLRLFFYFHVLPDRKLASALLTEDCPWWAGPLYKLIFPAVRKRMRAVYHIDAEGAKAAEAKLLAAFDHVEQRLEKRKFLAGPLFSRADLSVSALLTPRRRFTQPLPEPLDSFIAAHRDRPLMKWARGIYDDYRNFER